MCISFQQASGEDINIQNSRNIIHFLNSRVPAKKVWNLHVSLFFGINHYPKNSSFCSCQFSCETEKYFPSEAEVRHDDKCICDI